MDGFAAIDRDDYGNSGLVLAGVRRRPRPCGWVRFVILANVLLNPVGSFRNFGSASHCYNFLHETGGPRSALWAILSTNTTLRSRGSTERG